MSSFLNRLRGLPVPPKRQTGLAASFNRLRRGSSDATALTAIAIEVNTPTFIAATALSAAGYTLRQSNQSGAARTSFTNCITLILPPPNTHPSPPVARLLANAFRGRAFAQYLLKNNPAAKADILTAFEYLKMLNHGEFAGEFCFWQWSTVEGGEGEGGGERKGDVGASGTHMCNRNTHAKRVTHRACNTHALRVTHTACNTHSAEHTTTCPSLMYQLTPFFPP